VKIVCTAWSPGKGQGKQGSARRPRGLEMARRALPPSYSRVPGPPSSPSAGLPLDSMAVHKTTLTTGLLIAFYKDLWGPMDTQEDLGGPRRSSSWLFLAPRRSQEDPGKARDGQEGPGRALELLGAPRGSWLPWLLLAPPGSSWLLLAPRKPPGFLASMASWLLLLAHPNNKTRKNILEAFEKTDKPEKSCFFDWLLLAGSF